MDQYAAQPALRPASSLRGLGPYSPPSFDGEIDLYLDANEGAAPATEVLDALSGVTAEALRRYPDASTLESQIAGRVGVSPDRVVITNGGDDAIDRLCRAMLEPGRALVTHTPSFEMIARGARLAGAGVRETQWVEGEIPADELIGQIDDATGLVALVSPNNPTGGVIGVPDLLRVSRAARAVGAVLLVDLAYVEFADTDPTPALTEPDNVVMVRTFSKAIGLAGLRVGYAVAPEPVARWLRTTGGPYPVSAVSLALAAAAEGCREGRAAYVDRVRQERAELSAALRARGARVLPSQGNFVSAYVGDSFAVRGSLASRGIAVRAFRGAGALENLIRITLPGEAGAFERLRSAIAAAQEVGT